MSLRKWQFVNNTFLSATEGNYELARVVFVYTHNALNSRKDDGPFWQNLFDQFDPVYLAYIEAYDNWRASSNTQQGKTVGLNQQLEALRRKVNRWIDQIDDIHPEDTPRFRELFPNLRAPFTLGRQETRISAVAQLLSNLGNEAALAAVKADVQAFYDDLILARDIQKGARSITKEGSEAVDVARQAACVELYGVLGLLMNHYRQNPDDIVAFFDLTSIRNTTQVNFADSQIDPLAIEFITRRTFTEEQTLILSNTGNASLLFYLTDRKDKAPGEGQGLVVAPLTEVEVQASTLGNLDNRFLLVRNESELTNGSYEVVVM